MTRTFLLPWVAAALLAAPAAPADSAMARGDLVFDGVPDQPLPSADALDAYLSAREATPLGFTPKGQLLIATRFGDVDQLHLIDHAGGARRQITFLHEPIDRAAFSPDPSRSAYFYLEDRAGDGNTQLYYGRLGEIASRRLSDGKSPSGGALWSGSGREIAFSTSSRDGVSCDIDIVDPESGALPRLAISGDGAAWYPLDWSADDRKLLVQKHVSSIEDYLYVVDLSSGQKREVEQSSSKVTIASAKFSRDGTGVYLISNRDSEFARLRYVNLFTAEKTEHSAQVPGDVETFALSKDGHYLAFVSNEDGGGKLNVLDLRAHQDLIPPRLPVAGVIDSLSFDADSKRLAFGFSAANQPRDAYVLDMASNRLEAWTLSEAGPVDRAKLVVPRLSQFPTFDRALGRSRQLPLYIYEPPGGGAHPVLIMLHDGPKSQFRPGFDPWIEYVVNELGFAVLAPDVRGSSGYGEGFAALDRGTSREDAVKDVGALLVWIGLDPRFDAKHVVVSGGGYGGSLALAALANYGDRLRGAADFAGITDFVGYLAGLPMRRQNEARAVFGDERDPDMRSYLRRISPLVGADRITRPVLIVHGRNDPEVPIGESDQMVNRLRSRGGVVWYLKAETEGHTWRKQRSREAAYRTFAEFLSSLR